MLSSDWSSDVCSSDHLASQSRTSRRPTLSTSLMRIRGENVEVINILLREKTSASMRAQRHEADDAGADQARRHYLQCDGHGMVECAGMRDDFALFDGFKADARHCLRALDHETRHLLDDPAGVGRVDERRASGEWAEHRERDARAHVFDGQRVGHPHQEGLCPGIERDARKAGPERSEEHTSELQSLMRISYAGFCLKKKTQR